MILLNEITSDNTPEETEKWNKDRQLSQEIYHDEVKN